MEKTEIIEASKLFARFLGYEYYPKVGNQKNPGWRLKHIPENQLYVAHKMGVKGYPLGIELCRQHTALRFYNNWNWIMEVVKKINSDQIISYDIPALNKSLAKVDLPNTFKLCYSIIKAWEEI